MNKLELKYGHWSPREHDKLVDVLGEENARQLLSCRTVMVTFREPGHAIITAEPRKFKVWRTIKVGTVLKTVDDFQKAFDQNDFRLYSWMKYLLGRPEFVTAAEEREVDLALVTVEELGFGDPGDSGIEYQDICARVLQFGFELCEPEDGPQLRLQYPDQPKGEELIMVMKAIRGPYGFLMMFLVVHDGNGRWLCDRYGGPGSRFGRHDQFVVRLPRKK